eukprot:TRINITY_DN2301_c0_g1_i6.p1 TRINITY_DN2301_c0_g1~~TRINITY_DN2301_c0_g1_i6.p1  ORF type:complete len:630 (-),score=124.56 TRINITY_DN2301_c0_g1_i6:223-2112(-)
MIPAEYKIPISQAAKRKKEKQVTWQRIMQETQTSKIRKAPGRPSSSNLSPLGEDQMTSRSHASSLQGRLGQSLTNSPSIAMDESQQKSILEMLEKYAEKHIKPATPPKQEYVVKPKKKEDPRPTLEQRIKAQSENERKLYQQLVESRTIDPEPRNRYEADYYRQADPNMMEPKHIEKRLQVKFNMKFNKQIKKIWKLLKKNRDGNLEKLEYIKFHRIIYRLLVGPLDEDDWIKSVEEDWTSDSKGSETLSYEQFFDSLYQTADMWTESAHLSEYLLFAERLHDELEAWMAREQRKSTQPKPEYSISPDYYERRRIQAQAASEELTKEIEARREREFLAKKSTFRIYNDPKEIDVDLLDHQGRLSSAQYIPLSIDPFRVRQMRGLTLDDQLNASRPNSSLSQTRASSPLPQYGIRHHRIDRDRYHRFMLDQLGSQSESASVSRPVSVLSSISSEQPKKLLDTSFDQTLRSIRPNTSHDEIRATSAPAEVGRPYGRASLHSPQTSEIASFHRRIDLQQRPTTSSAINLSRTIRSDPNAPSHPELRSVYDQVETSNQKLREMREDASEFQDLLNYWDQLLKCRDTQTRLPSPPPLLKQRALLSTPPTAPLTPSLSLRDPNAMPPIPSAGSRS